MKIRIADLDTKTGTCSLRLTNGELVAVLAHKKVDSWIEQHNAEIMEHRQYWPDIALLADPVDWTLDYLELAA